MAANPDTEFSPDALWRLMVRRKKTPRALIEEIGVPQRTLGSWLTGEAVPKPFGLHALARALDVAESALFMERPGG